MSRYLLKQLTSYGSGDFLQVADLLNLDVDVTFYDTTSLNFEVNEELAVVYIRRWQIMHALPVK